MRILKKHLEHLKNIKRIRYHPLIHHIHKKHKISKKTLLYIKEYGPKSHALGNILNESIKVLLFSSLLSLAGGLALERTKDLFITIIPMIILFPTLNGMIGNYGIIVASRFTTLLHTGKVKGKWYKDASLKKLLFQVLIISTATGIISAIMALGISSYQGFMVTLMVIAKVIVISFVDVLLLVSLLFIIAIYGGYYYFKRNEDPDNFLIPLCTAIADFGNMSILAILVALFF